MSTPSGRRCSDRARPAVTEARGAADLRLAGFAVAVWLSALTALYLSARSGLALGAGAAVAAGLLASAMARTRASPWRWVGLAVLLGVVCGALATGARVSVREAAPLVELVRAGDPVGMEMVVRDDPRAARATAGRPPTYLVDVDLEAVRAEDAVGLRLSARALVLGGDRGWQGLLPGQRVTARGKLMAPRGGDLRAVVASVRTAPTLVGRSSWAQRAAGALREKARACCLLRPWENWQCYCQ